MKNYLLGLFVFVLSVSCVNAANNQQTFQQAVTFLKSGLASEAYDLLQKNHEASSVNPQEWFLLGVTAKQKGKLNEAKKYFYKVVSLDPKAARPKLELASIAQQQGDTDKAKQLLLDVKASNPPPGVLATIDRFLASLEAQKSKKNWRLHASYSLLLDDNVNAGPLVDTITLYGVPFTLSSDAKKTSDQANVINLGFDYLASISNSLGWQSSLSFNQTNYNYLNNLDTVSWSGSTGPAWRPNKKIIVSLPIAANKVIIGHSDLYYYISYGLSPQFRYMSNQFLSYSLGVSYFEKFYLNNSSRDSASYSVSPSFDYRTSDKGTIRFGISASTDDSDLKYLSNDLMGINMSYFHNYSKNLIMTTSINFSDVSYKGIEAAYTEKRHDLSRRINIGLSYRISDIDSDVALSISDSDNSSNQSINTHTRQQINLSLKKSF